MSGPLRIQYPEPGIMAEIHRIEEARMNFVEVEIRGLYAGFGM